MSLIFKKN